MAIFNFTASNSVHTTGIGDHAFDDDTSGADSLIVDAGAYLRADGINAYGVMLGNTKAWKVQVDGLVRSEYSIGIYLDKFNVVSTIAVGADGVVYGDPYGIYDLSPANITNAGKIVGALTGIAAQGTAAQTIRNTGTIKGGGYSIATSDVADSVTNSGLLDGDVVLNNGNDRFTNAGTVIGDVDMGLGDDTVTNSKSLVDNVDLGVGHDKITNSGSIGGNLFAGEGNDTVTNSGTIGIDVVLGNGINKLTNAGFIGGNVFGGADRDVVKNSGEIDGTVDLGSGDDAFTGGNYTDIVVDSADTDAVKLGGGNDYYFGIGNFNPVYDGFDAVDGGAGIDTYFATAATDSVYINLDNKAHDFLPFLPGAGIVAANTATGIGLTADTIKNFENVLGGPGSDIMYGSSGANVLSGYAGFDALFGLAGDDALNGGDGGDALYGGAGRDVLTGDAGADFFQFAAVSDSGLTIFTSDMIMDFESGLDRIDLSAIDAIAKNGSGNDAFTFIGDQAFSYAAGQLRVSSYADGLIVEADVNGDAKADFTIALYEPATPTLTAADFLL
jgi:hypothetical protein